jgi:hypothetical protein
MPFKERKQSADRVFDVSPAQRRNVHCLLTIRRRVALLDKERACDVLAYPANGARWRYSSAWRSALCLYTGTLQASAILKFALRSRSAPGQCETLSLGQAQGLPREPLESLVTAFNGQMDIQ